VAKSDPQHFSFLTDRSGYGNLYIAEFPPSQIEAKAPSGIYFYRISTGDLCETRKMIVLK